MNAPLLQQIMIYYLQLNAAAKMKWFTKKKIEKNLKFKTSLMFLQLFLTLCP